MNAVDTARTAFDAWRAELSLSAWEADPHLRTLLAHYGRDGAGLAAFGAEVSGCIDAWAKETNRDENLPHLRRYDDVGHRTERIVFHPDYHELGRRVYRTGLMRRYATPGQELDTLAVAYLLGQDGEAGHACPLACTAGMIKSVQAAGRDAAGADVPPGSVSAEQAAAWLERLYDPDYDRHAHASQFLTEVQGGATWGATPWSRGSTAIAGESAGRSGSAR